MLYKIHIEDVRNRRVGQGSKEDRDDADIVNASSTSSKIQENEKCTNARVREHVNDSNRREKWP